MKFCSKRIQEGHERGGEVWLRSDGLLEKTDVIRHNIHNFCWFFDENRLKLSFLPRFCERISQFDTGAHNRIVSYHREGFCTRSWSQNPPAVLSGRFFAKINSSKKPPYSFKMDRSGNLCNQACRGNFGLQTSGIWISRSVFFKRKGSDVDEKSCLPNGADLLTV